jgi:uncharacterized protein
VVPVDPALRDAAGQTRRRDGPVLMPLEMRSSCERCGGALAADSDAVICSYECTFCVACGEALARVCPSCGGELVARPRRAARS